MDNLEKQFGPNCLGTGIKLHGTDAAKVSKRLLELFAEELSTRDNVDIMSGKNVCPGDYVSITYTVSYETIKAVVDFVLGE